MGKATGWIVGVAASVIVALLAFIVGFGGGFAAGVNAGPLGIATTLADQFKASIPKCEAGATGPLTGLKRLIPEVGFLSEVQRANAQTFVDVGTEMGMSDSDIATGIATSMQEAGLVNVNYGDRDSLGLLQQRPSQGWGTAEQIMDPSYAVGKFFSTLKQVAGRDSMKMIDRAMAVQRPSVSAYLRTWKWDDRVQQIMDGLVPAGPSSAATAMASPSPGQSAIPPASMPPVASVSPSSSASSSKSSSLLNCLGLSTAPSSATTCERGTDAGTATTFQGTTIKLCRVDGIIVNATIARQLSDMVADAKSKRVALVGAGFRPYQTQVALYAKHGCRLNGSRGVCSSGPPTAKPGSSQHEVGLAIDFGFGGDKSSSGYQYLQANAERFGFKNFPKEAWHWSTTGR